MCFRYPNMLSQMCFRKRFVFNPGDLITKGQLKLPALPLTWHKRLPPVCLRIAFTLHSVSCRTETALPKSLPCLLDACL
jgi:hypothetical protein